MIKGDNNMALDNFCESTDIFLKADQPDWKFQNF